MWTARFVRGLEEAGVNLRWVFAGLLVLVPSMEHWVAAQDAGDLYRQFKEAELKFLPPPPSAEVRVGTFDAATGEFTGLRARRFTEPGGKPRLIPAMGRIDAVNAVLVFEIRNRQGACTVTGAGRSAGAAPGSSVVKLDVGIASRVDWTARCGTRSHSDVLVVDRPPIVGVGAFTIPALPIAIAYAPPQGQLQNNSAKYVNARSIGTTVTMTFGQENSTTRAAADLASFNGFKSLMQKGASLLQGSVDPTTKAAGVVLGTLIKGLGEHTGTETTDTSYVDENGLHLAWTEAGEFPSIEGKGPGDGDRIILLTNVRLAWLVINGELWITVLGHESHAAHSAYYLEQQAAKPGGDALWPILDLDPFVGGGPDAALDSARYLRKETYEGDAPAAYIFEHSVTERDLTARSSFSTRVDEYRSGWLSFVGVGVTEDKTVRTTVTHSRLEERTTSSRVSVRLEVNAAPDEYYAIEAFYDRLFGTIAFKSVAPATTDVVTGVAVNAAGQPLAHQFVTLTQADRRVTTRTDGQGRYRFRAPTIRRGVLTLRAGGGQTTVTFSGATIRNLQIRPRLRTPATRELSGGYSG